MITNMAFNLSMYVVEDSSSDSTTRTFLFVSLICISVLSILANSVVIITTVCTRQMRTAGSVFLVNLAVNDLMVGCIVCPFMLGSLNNRRWNHGQSSCRGVGFVTSVFLTGSALSSTAISLDRYYAIIYCLWYTSLSLRKYTSISLTVIWGVAIALSLPPLLGWNGIVYQEARFSCFISWESNPEYTLVMLITTSILPLAIMCFCYCRIIIVAREHANKIKDASGKSIQGSSDCHNGKSVNASGPVAYAFMAPIKRLSMLSFPSATKSFADPYSEYFNNNDLEGHGHEVNSSACGRQFKAIVRLVSLLLIFFLATIPFMGVNTRLSFSDITFRSTNVTNLAVTTTTWLSLLPSALDPLLYAVFSRNFRIAFQKLLKTRIHPDSQSEERKQRNSVHTYAAILRRPRSVSVISDPTYDRGQHAIQAFASYISLREHTGVTSMDGDQGNEENNGPKSSRSAVPSSGQFLQVPTALLGPVPRLGPDSGECKPSGSNPPEDKARAQVPEELPNIERELCKDMERCRVNNAEEGWKDDVKSLSDNKANIKIQLDLV